VSADHEYSSAAGIASILPIRNKSDKFREKLRRYAWHEKIAQDNVVGGVHKETVGSKTEVTFVRAFAFEYIVENSVDEQWEKDVFLSEAAKDFEYITVYRLATSSIEDEVAKSTAGIPLIVGICFAVMLAYTALAISGCGLVQMRGSLAVCIFGTFFGSVAARCSQKCHFSSCPKCLVRCTSW
jgi:hypothetical protein